MRPLVLMLLVSCATAGAGEAGPVGIVQITNSLNGSWCVGMFGPEISCCPDGWEQVGTDGDALVCVYPEPVSVLVLQGNNDGDDCMTQSATPNAECCPPGWEFVGSHTLRQVCVLY